MSFFDMFSNTGGSSAGGAGGSFQGLSSLLGSFGQGIAGMQQVSDGAAMQVQGDQLQAQVYRQAGAAALQEANYNIGLNTIQVQRQQDAISQTLNTTLSHNQAIMGASGVQANSKSYLANVSANLTHFEQQNLQINNSRMASNNNALYEGQLANTEDENKARAADYAGQIAKYEADQQNSKNMFGMVSNAFSYFATPSPGGK